jgi:soluble P-type ATPase
MKILIVAMAILAALSTTASAELTECKSHSYLAGEVMNSRQSGQQMAAVIDIVKAEADNSRLVQLAQLIVVDAYESPRFSTENYKARAISEFKNKWYLRCFKAQNK